MLDQMLDHMMISVVTTASQLAFFGISSDKQVIVKKLFAIR